MNNRIVFFSKDDLARFDMLARTETILNEFNTQKAYTNINDLIELYHVKQYIDSDLYLDSWAPETREKDKKKSKRYMESYMPILCVNYGW